MGGSSSSSKNTSYRKSWQNHSLRDTFWADVKRINSTLCTGVVKSIISNYIHMARRYSVAS